MIRRLALWLAEHTDMWARRLYDDAAEQLAAAEELVEVWEVRDGQLIDRTFYAPVTFIDEYALARHRHPAGKRRSGV